MKKIPYSPSSLDRRHFLKQAANTGLLAGIGPLLISCGGGDTADTNTALPVQKTEARTYFFDLSNANPDHDFFLVAGARHHRLSATTLAQVEQAKRDSPLLQRVSSGTITHVGAALPMSTSLQMCYIKSVPRGATAARGDWHMHTMFYHVPAANTAQSSKTLAAALACGKSPVVSLQSEFHACMKNSAPGNLDGALSTGLQASLNAVASNNSFCTGAQFDQYKDYFDHAMALVCHHPEIGSFDGPTLAYVQQAIVCADANLVSLAASLVRQGPATTTPGGWATLLEYKDPDTGLPKLAKNGDKLYITQHSAITLQMTGAAINSILPKVKNDPLLGANITGLAKTDLNNKLQGKMWVTMDGTPTRALAQQSAPRLSASSAPNSVGLTLLGDSAGPSFTARDVSSGNGYRVANVSGSGRTVTFTVENWYLRYLGLYIRFLDGAGQPIEYSKLPAATQSLFVAGLCGTYDCFMSLINQELVILGVPIRQNTQTYSIALPSSAASMQILAGGIGSGTNSYPDTVKPGAVMTVLLDLAVPGLFLAMSAVNGYASLSAKLSASREMLTIAAQIVILAISDSAVFGAYKDASVFTNLMPSLLSAVKKAPALYAEIQANMEAGEAEGAAEDAIPFGFGTLIQAVMALGAVAQMVETSAEIANAPWTFVTQIDATHDLKVTLSHDPRDTQGFPETATHYTLLAVCDSGSPAESGPILMPTTTRTQPLEYTFKNFPSGGKVTVTAGFYSNTDWLAGTGVTGALDNTLDNVAITIKENLVPLTATTVYTHKQKMGLDANGKHIWIAGRQPAVQAPSCSNRAGSLCVLQGITVSEAFGAVGYVWQSYSPAVSSFGAGAVSQLYQFANVSFTDQPEKGWLHSGGGFTSPPRLAYSRTSPISQNFYVDTSASNAVVRRINMTGVDIAPTFDAPGSNLAVGRFNFSSDVFLIHPTGKLISLNAARGKLEVLAPSAVPVADASAPLAQSFSGPGSREGLLNGPVLAAIEPKGSILVLEQAGNRIQAFDTGANPTRFFAGSSTMALKPQAGNVEYLDMAIEFKGYIYVLSRNTSSGIYSMDIYTPAGALLATTVNMNVAKLAVDLFRNVFTLNFDTMQPVGALTQPSISEWIPSTPRG